MQYDITRCIICKKAEYLDKERSYKNSTKEVTLKFKVALYSYNVLVKYCFELYYFFFTEVVVVKLDQHIAILLNI